MSRSNAAALALLAVGATAVAVALGIGVAPTRAPGATLARRPVPAAVMPELLALADGQARLSTGLRSRRPLVLPRRDPFRFVDRAEPASGPPGVLRAPALTTRAETPPLPARPVLTLVGIAEEGVEGARLRTAIISAADGLHLVREGERFGRRFQVVRIASGEVQIRDAVEQTVFLLVLR